MLLDLKTNVIILAPTVAGKMICTYLGVLALQKVFSIEKGVGLGMQPLSAIMEEKFNGILKKSEILKKCVFFPEILKKLNYHLAAIIRIRKFKSCNESYFLNIYHLCIALMKTVPGEELRGKAVRGEPTLLPLLLKLRNESQTMD